MTDYNTRTIYHLPICYFPQGFCIALHTPNFVSHDTFQAAEFMLSTVWVYINIFQAVMVRRFTRGEVHCGEEWALFTIELGAESHGKGAAVRKVIYSDEERSLG